LTWFGYRCVLFNLRVLGNKSLQHIITKDTIYMYSVGTYTHNIGRYILLFILYTYIMLYIPTYDGST